jgi:hypothetical protein
MNNSKEIIKQVESLNSYIIGLENKLQTQELSGLRLQTIESCSKVFNNMYSISSYERTDSGYFRRDRTLEEIEAHVMKLLDDGIAKAREIHALNVPKIEINTKIKEGLTKQMAMLGFKNSYSMRDPKSRAMYPKMITSSAGYINDLQKQCSTYSDIDAAERYYKCKKQDLENYLKAKKQEKAKIEAEKQKEIEKQKTLRELALFQVKYNLGAESSWDDILEVILTKDKYLRLAYFLEKNREDWNDGYSYAECGLNGFVAESVLDNEIEAEIQSLINNWDGDGRVFRDCEHNYGEIYGLADGELYKDLEVVKGKTERY